MRIKSNKLEVKYALEVYKEVPGFPSHRDITYVMIRALEDQNLITEEFVAENIWGAMKSCFGTLKEFRAFLDYASSPGQCPDEDILLEKTKADKTGHYRLIRNPWM